MIAIGFVILAAGHLVMYLFLTGDAREQIGTIESRFSETELAAAGKPGSVPQPGTPEYSPWLRSYETYWAAKEHTVHARHESLVRVGMILSFLVGLGLLGQGMMRASSNQRRSERESRPRRAPPRAGSRHPGRVVPMRPAVRPVAATGTRHRRSA